MYSYSLFKKVNKDKRRKKYKILYYRCYHLIMNFLYSFIKYISLYFIYSKEMGGVDLLNSLLSYTQVLEIFEGLTTSFVWVLGQGDAVSPWQLSFSDPATPIMEGIINFHNDLMFFIVGVTIFVLWMLIRCVMLFSESLNSRDLEWSTQSGVLGLLTRNSRVRIKDANINDESKFLLNSSQLYASGINHNTAIEIAWTVTPAVILMLIAVPSFALLYSIEEFVEPSLTVKCTGHQWYWCYEYSNCKNADLAEQIDGYKFESYMTPTEELKVGELRLLEVDHRLPLPINAHVQVTVTAADVLHCWAVPALGIKIDACPGRLNQTAIFIKRSGVFYGQCSEICGVNHGFMPIVVVGKEMKNFLTDHFIKFFIERLENN